MTNVMEKPMQANIAPAEIYCRKNALRCMETEGRQFPIGQSVPKEYLLTAAQMAQFAQDGLLMFDGFVPQELNEAVYADQQAGKGHWQTSEAIRAVFDWLPVRGMIQSLVGVNPVYDHSALHVSWGRKSTTRKCGMPIRLLTRARSPLIFRPCTFRMTRPKRWGRHWFCPARTCAAPAMSALPATRTSWAKNN